MGYLRNLLDGKALPKPRENDEANAQAGAGSNGNGGERALDPASIEQAADADKNAAVEAAKKEAVAAANARWNQVMTSDAGAANPKGAAKLLLAAGGAMSADEVIETLGDVASTDAKTDKAKADKSAADKIEADRAALAGDKNANPDTGPGAGGGEGDDAEANARKERRRARVEKGNQRVGRTGRGNRAVAGGRDRN